MVVPKKAAEIQGRHVRTNPCYTLPYPSRYLHINVLWTISSQCLCLPSVYALCLNCWGSMTSSLGHPADPRASYYKQPLLVLKYAEQLKTRPKNPKESLNQASAPPLYLWVQLHLIRTCCAQMMHTWLQYSPPGTNVQNKLPCMRNTWNRKYKKYQRFL